MGTVPAHLRIDEETKEYIADTRENFSSGARDIIETFVEAEQELGLSGDMQDMELVVLRTYKSAIEKNLQTMKAERDKVDSLIEERADDDEVTVVELHLDFDNENL